MEVTVSAVQVDCQVVAVAGHRTIDALQTGSAQAQGNGIGPAFDIALGGKHLREGHRFRIRLIDQLTLPHRAVGIAFRIEKDEDETVDVAVFLHGNLAVFHGLAVDRGLPVHQEAEILFTRAIDAGFQIVLGAGTDQIGIHGRIAFTRELDVEDAVRIRLLEGRGRQRSEHRLLRRRIDTLERSKFGLGAGDEGQSGRHQAVYECFFHCFIPL